MDCSKKRLESEGCLRDEYVNPSREQGYLGFGGSGGRGKGPNII